MRFAEQWPELPELGRANGLLIAAFLALLGIRAND
jgi:hypothetical protein